MKSQSATEANAVSPQSLWSVDPDRLNCFVFECLLSVHCLSVDVKLWGLFLKRPFSQTVVNRFRLSALLHSEMSAAPQELLSPTDEDVSLAFSSAETVRDQFVVVSRRVQC